MKGFGDFLYRDTPSDRGAVGWAIAGIAFLVAVAIVIVGLYVIPFGKTTYRIAMSDAGGIRSGTQVRVAGLLVGSVTDVSLVDDHVEVSVTADDAVFIGDQTAVEVRMLTVVGGVYVALLPAGRAPLGEHRIPASRVQLPYRTSDLLDDSATASSEVDAATIRGAMTGVTEALGRAPNSGGRILGSLESLTALIDRQQTQLKRLVAVSGEYSDRVIGQRQLLANLIERARRVFPLIIGYQDMSTTMMSSLADATDYVGGVLGRPYRTHVGPYLQEILTASDRGAELMKQIGEQVATLRSLVDRASTYVDRSGIHLDAGERLVDAANVCIPLRGRSC